MIEIERRSRRAGLLSLPDERVVPITDWRFETRKPPTTRWRTIGAFTAAEPLGPVPARGRIVLTLRDDDTPGARWRGAVRLSPAEPGEGLVSFVAVEELIWSG